MKYPQCSHDPQKQARPATTNAATIKPLFANSVFLGSGPIAELQNRLPFSQFKLSLSRVIAQKYRPLASPGA
jgi:hypothetical protein